MYLSYCGYIYIYIYVKYKIFDFMDITVQFQLLCLTFTMKESFEQKKKIAKMI